MDRPPKSLTIAGLDAPILSDSDPFELSCGGSGCTANCCCKSAPIVLNPYEISLICRAGRLSYEDLLDIVETERANAFPLVMLPRDPACHFWTERGCSIYPERPLACRLFPLGRVFDRGRSHFVRPLVNACKGLAETPTGTVADYLATQDIELHIKMADAWIEFVSAMEKLPLQDAPVTSVAFHMLVYSPDTPPAPGVSGPDLPPEERFLLRIATARDRIPLFLRLD